MMQQPLSQEDVVFCDLFCQEYLKDFNAYNAALRAGMIAEVAMEFSTQLFNLPYVQQKIDELKRTPPENASARLGFNQRKVEQLLWELAHDRSEKSSHSARVTAAMGLARIHKLVGHEDEADAQTKQESLIQMFKEFAQKLPA